MAGSLRRRLGRLRGGHETQIDRRTSSSTAELYGRVANAKGTTNRYVTVDLGAAARKAAARTAAVTVGLAEAAPLRMTCVSRTALSTSRADAFGVMGAISSSEPGGNEP